MYVLIVGGGKVGYHVARLARDKGHEVAVIELRAARAQVLTRMLGDVVLTADGSLPSVLEEAGCARADILAAVTGDDAVNFLVGTLGLRHFQAGRTIARLNDPRNERLFRLSGMEATVSSSAILAEWIEGEASVAHVHRLLPQGPGGPSLLQAELAPGSPADGRAVRDVAWPAGCLLVTVIRGAEVLVPVGATTLAAGDRLVLLAP